MREKNLHVYFWYVVGFTRAFITAWFLFQWPPNFPKAWPYRISRSTRVALSYDSAYMIVSSPSSILKNGFLLPTTTGFLLWWAKSHVQIVVCPTQQATAGPLGRPTESKRAGRDSAPPGAPCGDVANPGDSFLPGGRGRRLLSGHWFGDETYMKDYTQYIVMVGKCIWDVDFYAQFAFFFGRICLGKSESLNTLNT